VQVYALIQKIMAVPTPLLETIVTNIADQILAAHPMAESVYVKITKQQLSVPYFEGTTAVDIERTRSNYAKSNASI
jgi:dihydroneopterin aldolase